MEWLIAALIGALIGGAVYLLVEERESVWLDMGVGAVGGLAGKWLLSYIWVVGTYTVGDGFNLYSMLWAGVAALVVVPIARMLLPKSA